MRLALAAGAQIDKQADVKPNSWRQMVYPTPLELAAQNGHVDVGGILDLSGCATRYHKMCLDSNGRGGNRKPFSVTSSILSI